MKVSIIVPIYNVEQQLDICISSLLRQSSDKIKLQIILVNDGSTDKSGDIAKKYALKNPNEIIYLEQENNGVSNARNIGVKNADGDYISFVDADDYISDNLYLRLLPYMESKYDIIKIKASKVQENGELIEENICPVFEGKSGEEAFDILYKTDVMLDVVWGYIYRKEFYIANNFEFANGLYHEDFGLVPLIILKAKKVISTDVGYYNYVQTEKSITRGNKIKSFRRANDLLKHYDNMIKAIENYDISDKSKDDIKIYYTNAIILEVNNLKGAERKQYIKEIRKRKMQKNIKSRNIKQFIKKIILNINIELYLKIR